MRKLSLHSTKCENSIHGSLTLPTHLQAPYPFQWHEKKTNVRKYIECTTDIEQCDKINAGTWNCLVPSAGSGVTLEDFGRSQSHIEQDDGCDESSNDDVKLTPSTR